VKASGYPRAAADFYKEPAWVVHGIVDVEPLPGVNLDPACGTGNIPRVLRYRGLRCDGSEMLHRGFGAQGQNFFDYMPRVDNIVSNPPYGVIERFIDHALTCARQKVVVLARLALLEGQERQPFLRATPLARVWVSSRRVSMPPGNSAVEAKGGTVAFAWFVWEHGHRGRATVDWLPLRYGPGPLDPGFGAAPADEFEDALS
jgi:hypothetical protein